jgi:protein-disulfide isomerase
MLQNEPVTINDEGEATCPLCGKIFWRVPGKKAWIAGGRKPKAQDLLFAAHMSHLNKYHVAESNQLIEDRAVDHGISYLDSM